AVNDAPALAAIESGALTFSEGDLPKAITSTLTVTDSDSANLTGATVQITTGCANPEDVLSFTTQNGISGVYTPASCLMTLTDSDTANLNCATVQITTGCANPEDVLSFTTQNGISGVYTAASCLMTLSGSSSVANYQTALRSITYSNSSDNPSTSTRTVTFQADDGQANNHASNTQTRDITVTAANDAPVLANIEDTVLSYAEGDSPKAITSTL